MQLVKAILGYVSGQFTNPSRDREIDGGDVQPGGGLAVSMTERILSPFFPAGMTDSSR